MSGTEYTSAGGERKHYGPRHVEDVDAGVVAQYGVIEQAKVTFNYDELPAVANSGNDAVQLVIPANSFIVSARAYIVDDFDSTSGTTNVDVGLEQDDGTDIDADGLLDPLAVADGSNAGWVVGAGALVGASVGANDAYLLVNEAVGDLTAGKATLIVEYIRYPVEIA